MSINMEVSIICAKSFVKDAIFMMNPQYSPMVREPPYPHLQVPQMHGTVLGSKSKRSTGNISIETPEAHREIIEGGSVATTM